MTIKGKQPISQTTRVSPDRTGIMPVEDGARQVYWEYFGHGEKEAVVLLNGIAMLTRSWYRVAHYLLPDYDLLLYDFFGQGGSSQEDEPYYIHRFADYLIAIMDELGIDKIHPIGVSYGGFIAADLGRLHQERLHTLTLSGILLTSETLFQMYQDISLMFYQAPKEIFHIYTHYIYEKIFGENFARTLYGEDMERTRLKFYNRYADRLYCLTRLTEAQNIFFENIDNDPDAYRRFQTPTLLLSGEQDRAVPTWQQTKIVDIVQNCRQITIPKSGHLTYVEQPDIFWPLVRRFMSTKSIDFELPEHPGQKSR